MNTTVREFLFNTFGDSAGKIVDIHLQSIGGMPIDEPPHFVCSESGHMLVNCGGDAIMCFSHRDKRTTCVYLVVTSAHRLKLVLSA